MIARLHCFMSASSFRLKCTNSQFSNGWLSEEHVATGVNPQSQSESLVGLVAIPSGDYVAANAASLSFQLAAPAFLHVARNLVCTRVSNVASWLVAPQIPSRPADGARPARFIDETFP